jgi:hypothetical protein
MDWKQTIQWDYENIFKPLGTNWDCNNALLEINGCEIANSRPKNNSVPFFAHYYVSKMGPLYFPNWV